MGKQVTKRVPNPTGKGGFGERPEDIKPGPGRGHKRKPPAAGECILSDLEKGYSTPESPDDTPGVKYARKLANENYPQFLALWLKAGGGAKEVVEDDATPGSVGPKEERIEELIEALWQEWEAEDAQSGRVE